MAESWMKRSPLVGQEPALPLCYLPDTQHVPQNGDAMFALYRSSLADEVRGGVGREEEVEGGVTH